jgi:hypothetical protein
MTNREKQAKDALQAIAKEIKERLPENMGLALLAYEFGDAKDKKMMYISKLEFCDKSLNDPEIFGKDV